MHVAQFESQYRQDVGGLAAGFGYWPAGHGVHVPDASILPMGHDRQLLLFAPLQVAHDE